MKNLPMLVSTNNLKCLGKVLPLGSLLMLLACTTENPSKNAQPLTRQISSANPSSANLYSNLTDVSNIIIGGGMVSCSSMGAAEFIHGKSSSRCTQPWDKIILEDEAFSGHSIKDFSFEPTLTHPPFSYRIDSQTIQKIVSLPATFIPSSTKASLVKKLTLILNQQSTESLRGLTWAQLKTLLSSTQFGLGIQADSELSGLGQAALRHSLVEALPADQPSRLLQARSVRFLNDQPSLNIYRTIVAAAQAKADQLGSGRKPRIGIVTASAENPFNDRDIYFHAFKSAGAEVVWLPIDGGLRQAIDRDLCDFAPIFYTAYANRGAMRDYTHMDLVYPDLAAQQISYCKNNAQALNRELSQLDGIFFSGGNQMRHLESLTTKAITSNSILAGHPVFSEQLKILRERYAQGELVVAGSSAGDAMQAGGEWHGRAIPMIGGGDSIKALRHGFSELDGPEPELPQAKETIIAKGGLGFFQFGALDSHFSQRSREARLVRLVADSGIDYGFGVDENTALIVHARQADGSNIMQVIGAGGVFVVDTRGAKRGSDKNEPFRIKDVMIHYLHEGDKLVINGVGELTVQLVQQGYETPPRKTLAPPLADRVQDSGNFGLQKLLQRMGTEGADTAYGFTARSTSNSVQNFMFTLHRNQNSKFRRNTSGRMSFSMIQLDIDTCDSNCLFKFN